MGLDQGNDQGQFTATATAVVRKGADMAKGRLRLLMMAVYDGC